MPKNIKKIITNRGQIYSEILNNWKFIVGENLFKVCYPKSFKNSNKFGVSTLLIMVKRGHEVNLEYSKKEIINKMNTFFGKIIVEKIKFKSFEGEEKISKNLKISKTNVTKNKYQNKIGDVKNEKIKKSLMQLSEVFKKK